MSLKQRIYIFADLDDSLFQTRPKCPAATVLSAAATGRDGQPLSFFTPEQKALLLLLEQGTLIPVTGRNSEALARVHLPFSSYRITSHGALILTAEGALDEEWLAATGGQRARWRDHLETALTRAERAIARNELALRCRLIEDHGLPVYVSIKGDEAAIQRLAESLDEIWAEEGAQVHCNGHNLALLPPFANKERAVRFLMERVGADSSQPLFIGLGDSATDLPFLRLCHYALTPRGSQIQVLTW